MSKRRVPAGNLFICLALGFLFLFYQNCSRFEALPNSHSVSAESLDSDLVTFQKVNDAIFKPQCLSCHNNNNPSGGIDLSSYENLMKSNVITPYSSTSSTLFISIKVGSMPPSGNVESAKLNLLAEWIDGGAVESLDKSSCETKAPLLPRLTHYEYEMIIKDMTGTESSITELQTLPTLPPRYGFDNISNTKIDRVTAEAYINVAESVADRVISANSIIGLCDANLVQGQHNWENCAYPILKHVGERLFRRPLRSDEVIQYRAIFDRLSTLAGEAYVSEPVPNGTKGFNRSFREGLSATLISQLISPNFLFKMEYFPGVYDLTEKNFSIASKLSLSIGSTYPDEELWKLAENGSIKQESIIEYQIQRLLRKYSGRFSQNFAGQWLGFRKDLKKPFTDIDGAMAKESSLVFEEIINENQQVSHLLSPGYTYVNQLLSEHLDIATNTNNATFIKVVSMERGGILSQGHFLKSTSSIGKTSPIKRGIWVLDSVLCRTLPPLDAAALEEIAEAQANIDPNASLIEKMKAHRNTSKRCYTCHSQIDPIGLALENWDHLGKFRTRYVDGSPIVSDLEFNGRLVKDPQSLSQSIETTREFRNCVQKKLEAYFGGVNPTQKAQCSTQVTQDTPVRQLTSETLLKSLKEDF